MDAVARPARWKYAISSRSPAGTGPLPPKCRRSLGRLHIPAGRAEPGRCARDSAQGTELLGDHQRGVVQGDPTDPTRMRDAACDVADDYRCRGTGDAPAGWCSATQNRL